MTRNVDGKQAPRLAFRLLMNLNPLPALLLASILLSSCGLLGYNCTTQCGSSLTYQNATDRAVEVVVSDERFVSSPIPLEPGEEQSYSSGGIHRRGDLSNLFLTFRATDLSGEVVFCERVSWRQSLDRGGMVQIVLGDVRC
jgi:hypothetical protein